MAVIRVQTQEVHTQKCPLTGGNPHAAAGPPESRHSAKVQSAADLGGINGAKGCAAGSSAALRTAEEAHENAGAAAEMADEEAAEFAILLQQLQLDIKEGDQGDLLGLSRLRALLGERDLKMMLR